MSKLLEALNAGPILADGAMGSYLFERTGRLSEANHVYEALNVDNPDVVREAHYANLQAGARALTTNTFGANRSHLGPLGEAHRLAELNHAGVRVAREAIAEFRRQTAAEGEFFVLGSVGPTLTGEEPSEEAALLYREQVNALLASGVDGLLLETFA